MNSTEYLICDPTPERRSVQSQKNILIAWYSIDEIHPKLTCYSHDTDVAPLQAILAQNPQSLYPPESGNFKILAKIMSPCSAGYLLPRSPQQTVDRGVK